jgi:hypothetical protein
MEKIRIEAPAKKRRGPRLGRRRGAFISSPGACTVCSRTLQVGSDRELEQSGWTIRGNVGLCDACRADGWELPEGAPLPYRRSGRSTSAR